MRSQLVVVLGLVLIVGSGCDRFNKVSVDSDADKNLYFLGTKFGDGLSNMKLTDREAKLISQGFTDAAQGKKMAGYDADERAEKVQTYLEGRKNGAAQETERAGQSYLEQFVAKGGKKTTSGLGYEIIEEGEGTPAGPRDVVNINYEGQTSEGKVFASSKANGQPSRYPLDKIIPGWAEGIRLIKPGGKIKLVIPPELAYGNNGSPPNIPGGATLVMDLELVSVIHMKEGPNGTMVAIPEPKITPKPAAEAPAEPKGPAPEAKSKE